MNTFPCPILTPLSPLNLAIALTLGSAEPQQRRRQGRQGAGTGYGAPTISQPQYNEPVAQQSSRASVSHGGDHQGLDWLLESVPGQPGTDYPIYGQEALSGFSFDCNGQVEGGEVKSATFP